MSRVFAYLSVGALMVLLAMQFVRPTITATTATNMKELAAPPEVRQILKRSCYDCHTNQPQLLWYDRIAPAYWLVAHDVWTAREHLNFSTMGSLPAAKQKALLWEAVNQARLGAMPLPRYLNLHHEARLSDADFQTLEHWLQSSSTPPPVDDATLKTGADTQYQQWIHAAERHLNVAKELNGIDYRPEYRDWKVVSTTDRFDNNTLRIIYGNDVAVKAIAEHHTRPWPDGAIFAKSAWKKQVSSDGITRAGEFLQVEFMMKDHSRWSATGGWGYARWVGMELKPWGKDGDFAKECVGCHNPVRSSDYIYTFALEGVQ